MQLVKLAIIILITAGVAAAWYSVPAPPVKHRLAPAGVYYIRDYYSLTTSKGITGWTPGQGLREKLDAPKVAGCVQVSDGTYIAPLPLTMLTQDLDEAEALQSGEHAAEAQTQAGIAATAAKISAYQQGVNVATAADISRAGPTGGISSGTAASFGSPQATGGVGGGYYYPGSTTYLVMPATAGATTVTAPKGTLTVPASTFVPRTTTTERGGSRVYPQTAPPSGTRTY